ncbi:hypothetical protein [Deminuibacter soli]|uniref:Condensation domain-containing protein n=1 Tax=Deminuibacter soli TaxID=2291815 RepID=A0A3E1NH25_9BACT|nr:hypothetical protein [Deminuibacter soli]RFM27235.1 hypothetical protein DXN05_14465 [Deminuibacter soli]
MKRKLLIGERIMYVDAATPVNCVFTVRLLGQITLPMLETACARLQASHAMLRAVIRKNAWGRPYFVTRPQTLPLPIVIRERSHNDQWLNESEWQWKQLFNEYEGPLARMVWLRGPQVSELMLVCAHCICDGTTIANLMRELLQLIDNPAAELGTDEGFSHLRQLLPRHRLPFSKKLKTSLFAGITRVSMQAKKFAIAAPGTPQVLHWKLSETATTDLLLRSKQAGCSLHTMLCVAFLQAFKEVQGDSARGKLICPADIRRYVPALAKHHMFAYAPVIELSLTATTGNDFWSHAQSLKQTLMLHLNNLHVEDQLLLGEYFHGSVPQMIRMLQSMDGAHDVTLSNMGKLDIPAHYKHFDVADVFSPTVAFPWRNANTLVASSFRNRLDCCFVFNDAFLSKSAAERIRDRATSLLQQPYTVPAA